MKKKSKKGYKQMIKERLMADDGADLYNLTKGFGVLYPIENGYIEIYLNMKVKNDS